MTPHTLKSASVIEMIAWFRAKLRVHVLSTSFSSLDPESISLCVQDSLRLYHDCAPLNLVLMDYCVRPSVGGRIDYSDVRGRAVQVRALTRAVQVLDFRM